MYDNNFPITNNFNTPFSNSILEKDELVYPGNLEIEDRISNIIRWNAAMIVHKANIENEGIGGHISTYTSIADLYEVGFNHFFKGKTEEQMGDAIYFQGHSSPGIYARAYLEGRLTEEHLNNFRQETKNIGLSSYPHPRLMPTFWEYPTVSMGLGPLTAVQQAKFYKYLHNRKLSDTSDSKIWVFIGDGEMDEAESVMSVTLGGREKLDNLIFVVNCNYQRLDGPVRGNSKIIQEYERLYKGCGWNVIKLIWGNEWQKLLDYDDNIIQYLENIPDGDCQRLASNLDAKQLREELLSNGNKQLNNYISNITDIELLDMFIRCGGHDKKKIYNSYLKAIKTKDRPTVILVKTIKGYGLNTFIGKNVTHQKKKIDFETLNEYREKLQIPISINNKEDGLFYHPGNNSEEVTYLLNKRNELGGFLPNRKFNSKKFPKLEKSFYTSFEKGINAEVSTTMVFGNILKKFLDSEIGKYIVPIIPDEARTFGLDALFSKYKIFSSIGQKYTSVDFDKILNYKEDINGQIIQEGISEASAMSTFIASGTSYVSQECPTIPFYIFYSMFGFQRVGDLIWQAMDSRVRGFLLGATAGRTTLFGEGLQHQDGHSLLYAHTAPSCKSWDPAFAYELSAIIEYGIYEMFELDKDIIYYILLYNENFQHPEIPPHINKNDILKGLYKLNTLNENSEKKVRLIGSGPLLNEVIKAAGILEDKYDINVEIWSATSYGQLYRDAKKITKNNISYIEECIGDDILTVAVSDNICSIPELISQWTGKNYKVLGTDGFGRSDTKENLRKFYGIDYNSIINTVLEHTNTNWRGRTPMINFSSR